jgi:hypothetical protein
LELGIETLAHVSHAAGHDLELTVPLFGQLWAIKHLVNEASSVDGRVGPDWASDLFNTRHDNLSFLLASSDKGKGTSSLTIYTEVLSE